MTPFRCSNCNRLLAKVYPNQTVIPVDIVPYTGKVTAIDENTCRIEIKCPRCNAMNELSV